jgi:hypothetical protein
MTNTTNLTPPSVLLSTSPRNVWFFFHCLSSRLEHWSRLLGVRHFRHALVPMMVKIVTLLLFVTLIHHVSSRSSITLRCARLLAEESRVCI